MIKKIMPLCMMVFLLSACHDILDVKPSDAIGAEGVISTIEDMESAVNGAYNSLKSNTDLQSQYDLLGELMGDNVIIPSFSEGDLDRYYDFHWIENSTNNEFYSLFYSAITNINDVIERSAHLSNEKKFGQYLSELKCLRAYMHFSLVKLYGPLYANLGKGEIKEDALGIVIKASNNVSLFDNWRRNTVKEVYDFIVTELENNISDLPTEAQGYLSQDAVNLLLARIYLYMGDVRYKDVNNNYEKALEYLAKVSNAYELAEKEDYINSFTRDFNSESIFELVVTEDTHAGLNSIGNLMSVQQDGHKGLAAVKTFMDLKYDDVRFDIFAEYNSQGKTYYIPSHKFPGKQGSVYLNNLRILRYSEAFLIEAECQFQLGEPEKAAQILNELRAKRTDVEPDKYDSSITLDDILFERRLELFCEGHRAYDLWRNQIDVVRYNSAEEREDLEHTDMTTGTIGYDNYKVVYPIAESEMIFAEDAKQQNPGY